MNNIKRIGRFEFSVEEITATEKVDSDNFKVYLRSGLILNLNAEEKAELDTVRDMHGKTMQLLSMIGHMQAANRPH